MSYHENNLDLYTIGGITYNEDMVPIGFDEDYEGPKNALAGSVVASNATEYGLYTTSNGINTELRTLDSSNNGQGDTALTRNEDGTWEVAPGYQDVIKEEDKTLAEDTYQGIQKDNPNFWNRATGEEPATDTSNDTTNTDNASLTDDGGAGDAAEVTENYSLGRVDHIIQKLSLRNLVYPMDADFGNTQDYVQINQFTYKPINQDIFFGGLKNSKAGATFLNGLQNTSPKEKYLGLVKLPMPNQLQDSNNVAWGQDQLNAITAAVSAAVFGVSGGAVNTLQEIATGQRPIIGNPKEGQKESLLAMIRNTASLDNLGERGQKIKSFFNDLNNSSDARLLGRSVLGSALLNIAQFGVTPETALARGAGVVPNSNMQLLFNAPTLREFTFNWRLTARSREEATRVKNIIRFFKQGMAVKKNNKNKTGEGSFFLGTPNIFDVHFKTSKQNYEILDRNDSVLRIKTCALTGVAVNYTPDGMWNAYEKGMPTSVLLSLRFGELEPIFDTDYEEDPFKINNNVTDQISVPIDAIGY